jgi:hypothetical protein
LRVTFLVGNDVQRENALAVADFLPSSSTQFLNLWTAAIGLHPPTFQGHTPAPTPRLALRTALSIRRHGPSVLVIPQDMGLLQRIAARQNRLCGGITVLLPDGVVGAQAVTNGSRNRRIVGKAADRMLRSFGLVEGAAGSMGSSDPDVVMSWGPGWDSAFACSSSSTVLHAGCPRMDSLNGLRGQGGSASSSRRMLICSQPLHLPSWSQPYAGSWYTFLSAVVADERFEGSVKIRLHPAEFRSSNVPADVRAHGSTDSLGGDLKWASHVVSPFSTVLIDALAAGRAVASLSADAIFAEHVRRVPFFDDPMLPNAGWDLDSVASTAFGDPLTLREKYLVRVGKSGRYVAEQLTNLATAPLAKRRRKHSGRYASAWL